MAIRGSRVHEDLQVKYGGLDGMPAEAITTFMIKNLPRRYTDEALICELEGFVGNDSYDFLYLPWDKRRSSNVGYAFVNFVSTGAASAACDKLKGKNWRLVQSPKEIKLMPAHVQGLTLNLAHYIGSSVVEGPSHSPMVIQNGQRIDFRTAVEQLLPKEVIMKQLALAQTARQNGYPEESATSAPSASSSSMLSMTSPFSSISPDILSTRESLPFVEELEEQAYHEWGPRFSLKEDVVSSAPAWGMQTPSAAQDMRQHKREIAMTIDSLFSNHFAACGDKEASHAAAGMKAAAPEPSATRTKSCYMHPQVGNSMENAKLKIFGAGNSSKQCPARAPATVEVLGSESYMLAWQRMNQQLEALRKCGAFDR